MYDHRAFEPQTGPRSDATVRPDLSRVNFDALMARGRIERSRMAVRLLSGLAGQLRRLVPGRRAAGAA